MGRKRFTPEQIIGKLRAAEVALAQGQTTGQVCRILCVYRQGLGGIYLTKLSKEDPG